MKILIVGNGGREHALLWKLQRDAPDARFWITRGNGGEGGLETARSVANATRILRWQCRSAAWKA
jgi:phosphoribosylamine-glycine ligase